MPFPEKLKREVWNRQRGLCNYCGCGLTFNGGREMDHAVPKSWGGKDISDNAQLLCGTSVTGSSPGAGSPWRAAAVRCRRRR